MEVKLHKRSRFMLVLSLLGFIFLVFAYAKIGWQIPKENSFKASQDIRGRILTENGLVLAETINSKRVYPQSTLAGQLVGMMGTDYGLEGIEHFYEQELKNNQDITVTINPDFQSVAESYLSTATRRVNGQYGSLVAMETKTGKILAAASYPPFDPNNWREYSSVARNNHGFIDQYEPGSVIKALTVAALFNDNLMNINRFYPTPMQRRIGPYIIHDVVDRPSGVHSLNVEGILRYSSNVGMSHLVQSYPPEKLHQYFKDYGFGKKSAIGKLYNARGLINDWQTWGQIGRVTNSFGQGMSASSLQVAAAYNIIANNGVYLAPRIVLNESIQPSKIVLKKETSVKMRKILQQIIDDGIFKQVSISGYSVGGKTGTAQVSINGRYSNSIYNSVFSGFFPAQNPKVTMVVMVHGAKHNYHGSMLAAPIFRDVAAEMMARWSITPDKLRASGQ